MHIGTDAQAAGVTRSSGDSLSWSGSDFDLRGRSIAAEVTCRLPSVQAVAGVDWTRSDRGDFRSSLFGLRLEPKPGMEGASPYLELLGRTVIDRDRSSTLFDGADICAGILMPIGGRLFLDASACWSYTKGDAIDEGVDSLSELRLGFGVRCEL